MVSSASNSAKYWGDLHWASHPLHWSHGSRDHLIPQCFTSVTPCGVLTIFWSWLSGSTRTFCACLSILHTMWQAILSVDYDSCFACNCISFISEVRAISVVIDLGWWLAIHSLSRRQISPHSLGWLCWYRSRRSSFSLSSPGNEEGLGDCVLCFAVFGIPFYCTVAVVSSLQVGHYSCK